MQLNQIKDLLLSSDLPIIISTHAIPDGDAIGTEIALAHVLKLMNKNVQIINQDTTPLSFCFLQKYFKINTVQELKIPESALFIFVDVCEKEKLGCDILNLIEKINQKKLLFIDHHQPKLVDESCEYFLSEESSCTGEIIFDLLINIMNVPLDQVIAKAIYTAIISDTRSFKYSKTTSLSHKIASTLIDFGIHTESIQQKVFSNNNINQIHLLGYVLLNSKLSNSNKIAYVFLPHTLLNQYHLSSSETKGFINHLLTIRNVEIAVLFREDTINSTKISIRSKNPYPIDTFAESYGGGGRKFGASFNICNFLEQDINIIINKLEKLVSENNKI